MAYAETQARSRFVKNGGFGFEIQAVARQRDRFIGSNMAIRIWKSEALRSS